MGDEQQRTAAGSRRTLADRVLGDGGHLGWWTLPVFVAVALVGAVTAGTLAAVRYEQQVAALEEETRGARAAAERAAADVEDARAEALAEIEEQVAAVRGALEVTTPLDDVAASGVLALRVQLTGVGGAGTVEQDPGDGGDADPSQDPSQDPPPAPPAEEPPVPTQRDGVGFVVAVEAGELFVATTYDLVADPGGPDGVAAGVEVRLPGGERVDGVVHAWDADDAVAVVRVAGDGLEPLPWRPADEPIAVGDTVVLAGVTPGMVGVQLPGRVGALGDGLLVTDLPTDPLLDGAPLVDGLGRVVGLQGSTYRAPDGTASALPAALLCRSLVRSCELLEQPAP